MKKFYSEKIYISHFLSLFEYMITIEFSLFAASKHCISSRRLLFFIVIRIQDNFPVLARLPNKFIR